MTNPYTQVIIDLVTKEPNTYTYGDIARMYPGLTPERVRGIAKRNRHIFDLFLKLPSGSSQRLPKVTETVHKPLVTPLTELEDGQVQEVILAEQRAILANEKSTFAERKYKLLLKEHDRVLSELEALTTVASGDVDKFSIKPSKSKDKGEGVPCLIWSDWHIEERVDPRTISGKNEYTLDIARRRAERIVQSSLKLIERSAQQVEVSDVAIFALGDFITGNIHDECVENAQLQPVRATILAQSLLESNIDFLLENTNYTYTVYCKPGNHSRITKQVHISTEMDNSLELALYVGMMKRYEHNPRVRFHIEPSYYSIIDILGVRVRFHHGHAISFGGGVGGLHIPLRKAIKSWNETEKADVDFMGHYHSFLEHATFRYIVNGSLIGYNAYAERIKAVLEEPIQGYCLIDKKYGIRSLEPVFAE